MVKESKKWPKLLLKIALWILGIFVLLFIIGLIFGPDEPDIKRPIEGTSYENPVIINDEDPIQGMAKAFSHLETYACLDLGGRVEIKDRGLEERPDHDYYYFTVTCVNGEEIFYFQIDNLSYAFKEDARDD